MNPASTAEKESPVTDMKNLTTNAGCPVAHNQNVMTADPRGQQL